MRGYIKPNLGKDGKTIISYRIGIGLGFDPIKKKYRYHFETVRTKSQADKRLNELNHLRDTGQLTQPGKDTLGFYLDEWLRDYIKPNLSARTLELYSYLSEKHVKPSLGHVLLKQLKPEMIQKFFADKQAVGLSGRTVQLMSVCLNKSLNNATKLGLIPRNPVDLTEKPKSIRPEMHIMNENDLNRFLEASKSGEYYALFFTYLFTGARRSELLALQWSDVDLLGCQLSISKSLQFIDSPIIKTTKTKQSQRLVALTPSNAIVLRDHQKAVNVQRATIGLPKLSDSDYVFARYDGSPLLPNTVSHSWKKLSKSLGLKDIKLHSARHLHASILLRQGVHPKVVQERLGHASIQITLDTYSHTVEGLQKRAAEAFDNILNIDSDNKLNKELKELIEK
jgi:integrase